MPAPRQSQMAPSQQPVLKIALTEHTIVGCVGIRCDADGLVDLTIKGEAVPFNVSKGELLPLYGDFVIKATTDIATQVLY